MDIIVVVQPLQEDNQIKQKFNDLIQQFHPRFIFLHSHDWYREGDICNNSIIQIPWFNIADLQGIDAVYRYRRGIDPPCA